MMTIMVCRPIDLAVLLLLHLLIQASSHQGEPKTLISAMESGQAILPCDVQTNVTNDSLILLVWYKGRVPIYSFDSRKNNHWSSTGYHKSARLSLNLDSRPSTLLMGPLQVTDEGVYHCRVDFARSKSRKSLVMLSVIVLPGRPFFLDEIGTKVNDRVGPYHDGDTLVITCLAVGGVPSPSLTWWQRNELLDNSYGPSDVPKVTENQLILPLCRNNGNSEIRCVAHNNNITHPLQSTVFVELYLPAEEIHILANENPLVEGKTYNFSCLVSGGYPTPQVYWQLDGIKQIANFHNSLNENTGSVLSLLNLTASKVYNDKELNCLAVNILMDPSKGTKSHNVRLKILYPPLVHLSLRSNNTLILEGDNVTMQCIVDSNPAVINIKWNLNNSVMDNAFNGDDICNATSCLHIININRQYKGVYSCSATNLKGSSSDDIFMDVLYRPECEANILIDIIETTIVQCPSIGNPPPLTFKWLIESFNRDNVTIETANNTFDLDRVIHVNSSRLVILCWSGNAVGEQMSPCAGQIRLDSLIPPTPRNCSGSFQNGTLQVHCQVNLDSRLATTIEFQMWRYKEDKNSILILNETRDAYAPLVVTNLSMEWTYDTLVRVKNKFGQSDVVRIIVNSKSSEIGFIQTKVEVGFIIGLVGFVFAAIVVIYRINRTSRLKKKQNIRQNSKIPRENPATPENVDTLLLEAKTSLTSLGNQECRIFQEGNIRSTPPPVSRTNKPLLNGTAEKSPKDMQSQNVQMCNFNKESRV